MRRSNKAGVSRVETSDSNMVKGSGKETSQPMKKETNKNGIKRRQPTSSPLHGSTKSPMCITSFFSVQTSNITNTEVSINASKDLGEMKRHGFLTKEETTSIIIEDEIVPDIEQFKTDETPVAVPIHGPSTPHRINMPNNHSDVTAREVSEKNKSHIATTYNSPQHLPKKPARRKLNHNQVNAHRSTNISNIGNTNHKLGEYFPVRRSVRKCKKVVLEEKQRDIEAKVLQQVEEGLEVRYFPGKGRGVVTTRCFLKGEFVVEYIGELIDQITAKKREKIYAQDQNTGCYMYYFQHRNHQYCVDATAETDKLGRLVNHSRNGNLIARIIEVESVPHLVLTAKEEIPAGVEVTYDYGDRSREAIRYHPWLAL